MPDQSEPSPLKQEGEPDDGQPERADSEQVGLKGIASLERLRDRVESAARAMTRLREENAALAERIKDLEKRPAVDPKSTFLSLEEEPEQLKRKITAFIEAIDSYLERERTDS